ncbi:MAG TPA: hypothetical protein DEA55_02140 [Rhodospirillaceae bacterium]|nr:hypothetical protein [Rhodospirillaceae bacterium]
MLTVFLMYVGVTQGIKPSIDEMKKKLIDSVYTECLKTQHDRACYKQRGMFTAEDFTQELEDVLRNKEGAVDNLQKKAFIKTWLPVVTDPDIYQITCRKRLSAAEVEVASAKKVKLCQCASAESSRIYIESSKKLSEQGTFAELMAVVANLDREVMAACLKTLEN